MVPPDLGNWIAGLVDGEGCFQLRPQTGRATWSCSFRLALRADDRATIQLIHESTGPGTVTDRHWNGTSVASWNIYARRDAEALVEMLELYPLRSKKRIDYLIWRDAVGRRTDDPEVVHLAEQLMRLRDYGGRGRAG